MAMLVFYCQAFLCKASMDKHIAVTLAEVMLVVAVLLILYGTARVNRELLLRLAANGVYTTLVICLRNALQRNSSAGLAGSRAQCSKGLTVMKDSEHTDWLQAMCASGYWDTCKQPSVVAQHLVSPGTANCRKQLQLAELDSSYSFPALLLRDPALRLPPEVQSMLAQLSRGRNAAAVAAAVAGQPGRAAFAAAYRPLCKLTTVGVKVDHHPADFEAFSAHMAAAVAGALQQRLGAESLPKMVSVCVPGCVLLLGCSMTMTPPTDACGSDSDVDAEARLSAIHSALPHQAHTEPVTVRYDRCSRTVLPPTSPGRLRLATASVPAGPNVAPGGVSMWLLQPCVADGAESKVAVGYSSAPLGSEYRIVLYQDGVVLQDVKHMFAQTDGVVRLPLGEHNGHVIHVAMVVDNRHVVAVAPMLLLPAAAMGQVDRVHGCSSAATAESDTKDAEAESLRQLVADITYLTAAEQPQTAGLLAPVDVRNRQQAHAALTCHVLEYLTAHDMWHCVRHLLTVMYGEQADAVSGNHSDERVAAAGASTVDHVPTPAQAAELPPAAGSAQHQPWAELLKRTVGQSASGENEVGKIGSSLGAGSSSSRGGGGSSSTNLASSCEAAAVHPTVEEHLPGVAPLAVQPLATALRPALRGRYDRTADERAYLQYKVDTMLVVDVFGALFHAVCMISGVMPRGGESARTWRQQCTSILCAATYILPTLSLLLFRSQARRAREWLLIMPSVGMTLVNGAAALGVLDFTASQRAVICGHVGTYVLGSGIVRPSAIQVRFPLHAAAFGMEFAALGWLQHAYGNSWAQAALNSGLPYGVSCVVAILHDVFNRRRFARWHARVAPKAKEA